MKTLSKKLVLSLILAALAVAPFGCGGGDETETAAADASNSAQPAKTVAAETRKAPDFNLMDLEGRNVRLSDYAGEVVIVDFWATWCPPCKKAMPHLQEIHEAYGDKGIKVLAISTDQKGVQVVKPFIDKAGYTFTVLLMDDHVHQDFGGVQSIPTTFIISPSGDIVEKFVGYRDMSVYLEAAKKARG